jgi:hypothetical protein
MDRETLRVYTPLPTKSRDGLLAFAVFLLWDSGYIRSAHHLNVPALADLVNIVPEISEKAEAFLTGIADVLLIDLGKNPERIWDGQTAVDSGDDG